MNKIQTSPSQSDRFQAGLLSVICPGLGQIFNGQLLKGILIGPVLVYSLAILTTVLQLGHLPELIITILILWYITCFTEAVITANKNIKNNLKFKYSKTVSVIYFILALIITPKVRFFGPIEHMRAVADSMLPTLSSGQRFIVDKTAFKNTPPKRGELITFKTENVIFLKRVIGIPGDRLEMKNKVLFLNGNQIPRIEITDTGLLPSAFQSFMQNESEAIKLFYENIDGTKFTIMNYTKQIFSEGFALTVVPNDSYFVMGDNRDNSRDSRFIGFIPKDKIHGKVIRIY